MNDIDTILKTQYDYVLLIHNKSILTASYTAVSEKRGLLFHNFTSFIMLTDEILDYVGTPQSFQERRSFNKKKRHL